MRARHGIERLRNNPHPARGRKRISFRGVMNFEETIHAPQGDGIFAVSIIAKQIRRNNLLPARGRKLGLLVVCFDNSRINMHPVRGRKLVAKMLVFAYFAETIHTPQGDGNKRKFGSNSNSLKKQLTPREGTKVGGRQCLFHSSLKQLTPQGDGNSPPHMHTSSTAGKNSHPARGRKPLCNLNSVRVHGEITHPRKGTHQRKGV